MGESSLTFSKETGKPNPVSLKEYLLMDRHEHKSFFRGMDRKEQKTFLVVAAREASSLRLNERREIQSALVKKLEARKSMNIIDKIETSIEKARLARLMLPPKEPILFRKLRTKEFKLPKWLGETKSPYLIAKSGSI